MTASSAWVRWNESAAPDSTRAIRVNGLTALRRVTTVSGSPSARSTGQVGAHLHDRAAVAALDDAPAPHVHERRRGGVARPPRVRDGPAEARTPVFMGTTGHGFGHRAMVTRPTAPARACLSGSSRAPLVPAEDCESPGCLTPVDTSLAAVRETGEPARLGAPRRAPQAGAAARRADRAQEVPRAGAGDQLAGRLRGARRRAPRRRARCRRRSRRPTGARLADRIGLVPILRAGLGMVDAMLELMPTAQVWHLGLFRDERTLRPVEYYNKLPDTATVDVCLILDPMLATGGSATAAIDVLKNWGAKRIKLLNLIAAPEGVRAVSTGAPGRADPLRGARPAAQRARLHHAGPRRRRRPPVRHGPHRLIGSCR